MLDAGTQRLASAPSESILRGAGVSERLLRALEAGRAPMTTAQAMALAATLERLAEKGFSADERAALFSALADSSLSAPHEHADAIALVVDELVALGVARRDAVERARAVARARSADVGAAAEAVRNEVRANRNACPAAGFETHPEEARATRRIERGGWSMGDSERRNGADASRIEKERERLERERERIERERDRAEHERAKLEKLQEELEARLERQEERLQELEDELEERMEALEEAEESLEDIEVEGVEGVREVLDAVSDWMPNLMRGIQTSVYSPERVKAEAEAFASFYKSLTAAGMPDHTAAEMTRQHFEHLRSEMKASMIHPRPGRKGRRGPGPDFDPLGPNFDPLGAAFRAGADHPEPPSPGADG